MKFRETVYEKVKQIPEGMVSTYSGVARALGNPKAVRAVGNALHNNPEPVAIPCHRVLRSDGMLASCGHRECTEKRRLLLEKEGVRVRNGRVDLNKYLFKF